MIELILSSTIVTGKIYFSELTNNLLFVCKKVLKQSRKELSERVKTAIYHRSDDISIDLMTATIDMMTGFPISFYTVNRTYHRLY